MAAVTEVNRPLGLDVARWGREDMRKGTLKIPDGGGTLEIQDQYSFSDEAEKWHEIENLSNNAKDDKTDNTWFINFSSCSGGAEFPDWWSKVINSRLLKYTKDSGHSSSDNEPSFRLGTIVMDFPNMDWMKLIERPIGGQSNELIDAIIKVNFTPNHELTGGWQA